MDNRDTRQVDLSTSGELAPGPTASLLELENEIRRLHRIIATHLESCPAGPLSLEGAAASSGKAADNPGAASTRATPAVAGLNARPPRAVPPQIAASRPPAHPRRRRPATALVRAARAGLGALVSDLVDF